MYAPVLNRVTLHYSRQKIRGLQRPEIAIADTQNRIVEKFGLHNCMWQLLNNNCRWQHTLLLSSVQELRFETACRFNAESFCTSGDGDHVQITGVMHDKAGSTARCLNEQN
jgi:hypothetical protein